MYRSERAVGVKDWQAIDLALNAASGHGNSYPESRVGAKLFLIRFDSHLEFRNSHLAIFYA